MYTKSCFTNVRLHREALKQSATDPLSGKIDVGILTTGLSTTARKKRADLVAGIKDALKKKGKVSTVSWNKLFTETREASQIVSESSLRKISDKMHLLDSRSKRVSTALSRYPSAS